MPSPYRIVFAEGVSLEVRSKGEGGRNRSALRRFADALGPAALRPRHRPRPRREGARPAAGHPRGRGRGVALPVAAAGRGPDRGRPAAALRPLRPPASGPAPDRERRAPGSRPAGSGPRPRRGRGRAAPARTRRTGTCAGGTRPPPGSPTWYQPASCETSTRSSWSRRARSSDAPRRGASRLLGPDPVELHPRALLRGPGAGRAVRLVLGVDPDVGLRRDAEALQDREDLERGGAVAGVDGEGEAGREVAQRARLDELAVDVGERPRVDADLHEAGADARALDAVAGLRRPAVGELPRGLRVGVPRHRDVVRRAVVAGVRDDVQAARLRQAAQQQRVAAEVGGRALEERAAAPLPQLLRGGGGSSGRPRPRRSGSGRPSRPRRSPRARARGRASTPIWPASIGPRTVWIVPETGRGRPAPRASIGPARAAPAAPASAARKARRSTAQAFFRTSFSKSQVTGALRLTDSFTMWATAAAWWPRRPSSTEGLRVRTESKKRATWM